MTPRCCRCRAEATNAVSVDDGTLVLCARHAVELVERLATDRRVQVGAPHRHHRPAGCGGPAMTPVEALRLCDDLDALLEEFTPEAWDQPLCPGWVRARIEEFAATLDAWAKGGGR